MGFWVVVGVVLVVLSALSVAALLAPLLLGTLHGVKQVTPDAVPPGIDGVQYVGHGSVLIQLAGVRILTDPVLTRRFGGFFKRFVTPGLDPALYSDVDVVVISHWHRDHLHPRSLKLLNPDALLLVPVGLKKSLRRKGFQNVRELPYWEAVTVKGVRVTSVPAAHKTARHPAGYVFQVENGSNREAHETPETPEAHEAPRVEGESDKPNGPTIYFAGDTALAEGPMREIGRRFGIDLALLPIGCYRGRVLGFIPVSYRRIHMAPADLPDAIAYLAPRRVVPIHWGTFVLGTEPIGEAKDRLEALVTGEPDELGVRVVPHGRWRSLDALEAHRST